MVFVLPPKSQVGTLAAEIANEGVYVNSAGEAVNWNPPPIKPVIPDWSQIKSIQKYFGRIGYSPWPAWIYHPTEEARIVKDAHEAAEYGICYREATEDEKIRFGHKSVWDWDDTTKWRPKPFGVTRNLEKEAGKEIVRHAPNPVIAQNELVRQLIPEVAAAVTQALKMNGPAAPEGMNAKDWDDFKQFQIWKQSAAAMLHERDTMTGEIKNPVLAEDQERSRWVEEAKDRGIHVDGRMSVATIKKAVEKAAQAA